MGLYCVNHKPANMHIRFITTLLVCLSYTAANAQQIENIILDSSKNNPDYYVAIRPASKNSKGAIVLLTSFLPPENLLTETKLQNTAYANELLIAIVPMKMKLYADSFSVKRINIVLADIASRFSVDTSRFVMAGYDEAGNIALRYAELTYEHKQDFFIQPKAVFTIDTHVDLFGLWHWSENQIKKNYWQGAVGDAKFYLDAMTKENGTIYNNAEKYKLLSPFYRESDSTGYEQYLKNIPVRLYYDIDINWQLQNRRNSFYDTKIPDGSELIKRLLQLGNTKAELVAAKTPGKRSDGQRNPNALSIVDEVDCIQWIRESLGIINIHTWNPPYELPLPQNWGEERFVLPPDFAPAITYKGVEDVRFAPGWGDPKSEEHWTYSFLWWLDDNAVINADKLQEALKLYYNGLVAQNITSRNIPANKVIPTTVTVKKIKSGAGDPETYSATIHMLDYHTNKPITLNGMIRVKTKTKNQTGVYFGISPQPLSHSVWQSLNDIGNRLRLKE
jgi:hypothetical protein